MSDTLSMENVTVQWADEVSDLHREDGLRFILFPHRGSLEKRSKHLPMSQSQKTTDAFPGEYGLSVEDSSTQTSTGPVLKDFRAVRVPPTRQVSSESDQRYILLKKYDGYVTARGEETFTARLSENFSDYPVLEAEFDLDEVSEADRPLIVEGYPLVWTIGYRYEGSTRKRESVIYLRRLPPWSDKEIEDARRASEELTRAVRWE